ncbi:MAG: glycosyltransferase [Streptosporangiaceae bacterium]|nr:glycosyltransferase [Streptosporangiaceae bacterium]
MVIPAANEERHLGRCLASVGAAREHLYRSGTSAAARVVAVLDGCRDGTADIAAAFDGVELVAINAGSVGTARRAGAAAALAATGCARRVWLANTDADSEVPVDWLTSMVTKARLGAHVVLGTVTPGGALCPAARAAWDSRHSLQEGHPHVHGANFGIRGDAYLALGGWQPFETGEDADLATRAARAGLRITRTGSIPVVTSVRRDGRAPRGFSSYLRALPSLDAQEGPPGRPWAGKA